MYDHHESLHDSIRYLRDSLDAASAAPGGVGTEAEEWLRRREHSRETLRSLLTDESIEAEMRMRDDVPALLGHLVAALRAA